MELRGKVKSVGSLELLKNDFKKREIVVETEERYPQFLPISFLGDKVSMLEGIRKGDRVLIMCNVQGKEWADPQTGELKYFVSLVGWKVSLMIVKSFDSSTKQVYPNASDFKAVSPPSMETMHRVSDTLFETMEANDLRKTEEYEDDLPF